MDYTKTIFLILFILLCAVSIIITCLDKYYSRHRRHRRISEKTLLIVGSLGCTTAMYFTMRIIRHKTRHNKFMYGLPAMIVFKMAFIFVFLYFL